MRKSTEISRIGLIRMIALLRGTLDGVINADRGAESPCEEEVEEVLHQTAFDITEDIMEQSEGISEALEASIKKTVLIDIHKALMASQDLESIFSIEALMKDYMELFVMNRFDDKANRGFICRVSIEDIREEDI